MTTMHMKGGTARNWFAEQIVKNFGPDEALEKTCGPMHESVKRVIAEMSPEPVQYACDKTGMLMPTRCGDCLCWSQPALNAAQGNGGKQ